MKKFTTVLLIGIFFLAALAGCGDSAENQQEDFLCVFSFCGSGDLFSVSNGVIVLTPQEQTVYCGAIEAHNEIFDSITACTGTLYFEENGEENILISNGVVDKTGGTINVFDSLGSVSGGIIPISQIDALRNGLRLDLSVSDISGDTFTFTLDLDVTEVLEQAK